MSAEDYAPFVVRGEGDEFTVDAREGWLSFISGYTKLDWPDGEASRAVLVPAEGSDMRFLRAVLKPGIHEPLAAGHDAP